MQFTRLIILFSCAVILISCDKNVAFKDLNGRWELIKVETYNSEEVFDIYLSENGGVTYEYIFNDSIFIIKNIGLYDEDFDETHKLWLSKDTIHFERLSDFKSSELKAVSPPLYTVCIYHSYNSIVLRTHHKEDMYSTHHLKRMKVESEVMTLDDYRELKTD